MCYINAIPWQGKFLFLLINIDFKSRIGALKAKLTLGAKPLKIKI